MVVGSQARQLTRAGTGGDDDVGRFQRVHHGTVVGDFNQPLVALTALEGSQTVDIGNLVLLEQEADARGVLGDDAGLALQHGGHVHLGTGHGDAVLGKVVLYRVEVFRGLQQRLGRDATHVQAGTTQRRLAFRVFECIDASGIETQLGSTNGSHITARAATDYNYIKLLAH